jgi:hypothetical protein
MVVLACCADGAVLSAADGNAVRFARAAAEVTQASLQRRPMQRHEPARRAMLLLGTQSPREAPRQVVLPVAEVCRSVELTFDESRMPPPVRA